MVWCAAAGVSVSVTVRTAVVCTGRIVRSGWRYHSWRVLLHLPRQALVRYRLDSLRTKRHWLLPRLVERPVAWLGLLTHTYTHSVRQRGSRSASATLTLSSSSPLAMATYDLRKVLVFKRRFRCETELRVCSVTQSVTQSVRPHHTLTRTLATLAYHTRASAQ